MNDSHTSTAPEQPSLLPGTPAPMLESEARNWAMLIHLLAVALLFISGGFLSFVAPLIIWLMQRERSALVDFHGKQNLNLQITLFIVGVLSIGLGIATLGVGLVLTLPLWAAYWIYALVISIVAGVKAQSGHYYAIRFVIPFIR